jgi:DNA helicase HerA-like ATPase
LVFSKPDYYPIRSFRDFETDPMSSLSSSVSTLSKSEEVWLQILTRPIADKWQQEGFDYVNKVREGQDPGKVKSTFNIFFDTVKKEISEIFTGVIVGLFTRPAEGVEVKGKYTTTPKISAAKETELKSIENKLSRMGFEAVIRVVSAAPEESRVDANLRGIIASFEQFSGTSINSLISKNEDNKELALNAYKKREFDPNRAIILNTEELATIYHFPLSHIDTPNISWVYSRKSEPPANLPTENCTYLGETVYRNQSVKFGIRNDNDDRLRHVYVIGKSGTGKSSLFVTMMAQDIANGEGAAILDPHGETIENVLDRIPDNRIEDVIYLDPSDTEYPVGLNLLEIDDPSQKNLMASGLVSAIKQHFDFSWGPRLEYLLNYCVLTLLEVPGTTMLGITRLLEDQNYLNYILHFVKDPVVQKFWSEEFKQMKGNQKLVTEAISPIQNKVNRFLASTTIRNILGQRKSTIDIWDAMNSGKILLMNLSKGKIGQDNANLLGALLVSRIQFYALQRAKIPNEKRRPFYLYVDEFQNFATGSFEEILSESRKYKLGLNLTHQFTGQLPEDLLKAVYGNVGTIITFALGAPDAKELAKEFAPYFSEEDIISLERFQVYMKLMVDGMTSHPFSAKILVPWDDEFLIKKTGNKEKVLQRSREKYGVPREKVESKVNKWLSTRFDKGMAIAQEYSGKNINGSIGNNFESTEEK